MLWTLLRVLEHFFVEDPQQSNSGGFPTREMWSFSHSFPDSLRFVVAVAVSPIQGRFQAILKDSMTSTEILSHHTRICHLSRTLRLRLWVSGRFGRHSDLTDYGHQRTLRGAFRFRLNVSIFCDKKRSFDNAEDSLRSNEILSESEALNPIESIEHQQESLFIVLWSLTIPFCYVYVDRFPGWRENTTINVN